jgi:hypothetical protein
MKGVDLPTIPGRFEWSDPDDALGERTFASPHATQVDVILDCMTADGKTTALLIEVKLSEHDFSGCSAWLAPANDRRFATPPDRSARTRPSASSFGIKGGSTAGSTTRRSDR